MPKIWQRMTVKKKLNLVMLVVTFLPMSVALGITFYVFDRGFYEQQQQDGQKVLQVVHNLIAEFERNLQDITPLLQQNEILTNSVYYAKLLGNTDELQSVVTSFSGQLSLNILEISDLEGNILAQARTAEHLPLIPLDDETIRRQIQQGEQALDIVEAEGMIVTRIVAPLKNRDELVGAIIGGRFIDDEFIRKIAAITKSEISLFDKSAPIATSDPAFAAAVQPILASSSSAQDIVTKDISISLGHEHYTVFLMPFMDHRQQTLATIAVGVSHAEIDRMRQKVGQLIVALMGIFFIIILVVGHNFSRLAVRALVQLTGVAQRVADGQIDMAVPSTSREDEIGMLHRAFRNMLTYFQEMTATANRIAEGDVTLAIAPRSDRDRLGKAVHAMSTYLQEVADMVTTIANGDLTVNIAVGSERDVFRNAMQTMLFGLRSLVRQIHASAQTIVATSMQIESFSSRNMRIVQTVHQAITNIVTTITQLGKGVEAVAHNMAALSSSVEVTSASVSEMTLSIGSIAANTADLAGQMQGMMVSTEQALQKLNQVASEVTVSEQLTQRTIQDALAGQQAVEQVHLSMELIHQTNQKTVDAITRFAEQAQEIRTILEVIRGITEQSSLLALNASIIAAQAGSHGRGFAVVADEMRNLANAVGNSTKDIAIIVQTIHQQTETVVMMIHENSKHIAQGVTLTHQAKEPLQNILASAQRSSQMVTHIAEAVATQRTASEKTRNQMQQVNDMTTAITKATNEQTTTTHHIQQAIAQIAQMASQTQEITMRQSQDVQQMIASSQQVSQFNQENLESSSRINEATDNFAAQAKMLIQEVDRFKIDASSSDVKQ